MATSSDNLSNAKLTIPAFLKVLASAGMPIKQAMELVPKLYKSYASPQQLSQMSDESLSNLGIAKKEDRKLILAAVQKAGYLHLVKPAAKSTKKPTLPKRKRDEYDLDNEPHDAPAGNPTEYHSLHIKEIMDVKQLQVRTVIVNRAPVTTAWAMIVAERIGFKRDEALSIASVYTELNAISKGISLQIYSKLDGEGMEASSAGAQPYTEFMGRRIPLLQSRAGLWRALSKGEPVLPAKPFQYITKAFHQTLPYVLGAMRLLADSYEPKELNDKAFALYCEFRPIVSSWGARSELRCSKILDLRKRNLKGDVNEPAKHDDETEWVVVHGDLVV